MIDDSLYQVYNNVLYEFEQAVLYKVCRPRADTPYIKTLSVRQKFERV